MTSSASPHPNPRSDDWVEQAACRGMPTHLFFPPRDRWGIEATRRALRVCDRCIVQRQCLEEALATEDRPVGVRGGFTAEVRHAMRRSDPQDDSQRIA